MATPEDVLALAAVIRHESDAAAILAALAAAGWTLSKSEPVLREALERLTAWHEQKAPEGPDLSTYDVERWWELWGLEETHAFEQARAALASEPVPPE